MLLYSLWLSVQDNRSCPFFFFPTASGFKFVRRKLEQLEVQWMESAPDMVEVGVVLGGPLTCICMR